MSAELDCTRCGACCIADYDDVSYVDLDDADYRRLTDREKRLLVHDDGATFTGDAQLRSLLTKHDRRGNCRCKALRGTIGRRVYCSIYERRPRACVRFEPGSPGCRAAREASRISV